MAWRAWGSIAVAAALCAAPARANGPIGDAPVFARIEALRPVAAALSVDGDGSDWGAIPNFTDPAGDAGGDPSRDIVGFAIAPLADSLVVRIQTAGPPSSYDLSFWLDIDFMGQEPLDLEIGLYAGFPDILWTYPEGGTPFFQTFNDSQLAIGNVVEARIPYAVIAPLLPADMAAALTGPNARSWVRVTPFTMDYSQASVPRVDTGPAVASFRLVPTPYALDPPLPAPGTPVPVPPALADQIYVGQGAFGLGSHAGYWAYDLNQVDALLHPDANSPSPNLADYYSFGKPVYAPLAGVVTSLDSHNPDLPPRSAATGNPNFVTLDIGGGNSLFFDHLKQDSITVGLNQSVAAGQQIGNVGHSGSNTWPHLHLGGMLTADNSQSYPLAHTEVEVGLNPTPSDPWLRWLPVWALREGMFEKPAGALCGDVLVDQVLNAGDVSALRARLANPTGAPLSADGEHRCTVIGAPHACGVIDATIVRRKLATLAPGISQVCPAALGT